MKIKKNENLKNENLKKNRSYLSKVREEEDDGDDEKKEKKTLVKNIKKINKKLSKI